jgi:hypothetical protein
VPYRVGIVDLDEGLRIATRVLADVEPKLDTAVEIVVLNYKGSPRRQGIRRCSRAVPDK